MQIKKQQLKTHMGTTDWFQIGKGVQGCILLYCLFNFYAEDIMQNAGLDETQAGIKIAERNINNLNMQMTPPYGRKWRATKKPLEESEGGEWKSWLKLNIQKTKIMASGPITSRQVDGETTET